MSPSAPLPSIAPKSQPQALGHCACHGHGTRAGIVPRPREPDDADFDEFLLARRRHAADHGAGIEIDEWRTRRHDVAHGTVQRGHSAAEGTGTSTTAFAVSTDTMG
jgi:hypothetical protein